MRFYDTWDSKSLVSVTTINDVIDKPSLRKWYGTSAGRRCVENLEEVAQRLKAEGKLKTIDWLADAANEKRDNSAATGTRVHKGIERLIEGTELETVMDDMHSQRERQLIEGYLSFKEDYELEVEQQEVAVCNPGHGWAGRYDVAGRCYGSFGESVVIDWKTGATGPHATWALQLAAYAHGTHLVTGGVAPPVSRNRALAVRLYPGSYSTHWLDGQDGRASLKELYMVFRATRVVWEFEQQSVLWN